MEEKKSLHPVRMVAVTVIGTALYGVGGLLTIPIFANTTMKPAIAILALFAAVYGPIIGFLVGFLGQWLTDLFAGLGIWPIWMLGSGIVGIAIGLFKKLSKDSVAHGELRRSGVALFILFSFLGNFIGYMVSALLEHLIYAEPMDNVITQQIIVAFANTIVTAILGTLLLHLVANRNKGSQSLPKVENV